jgi:hypothetical protein
VHLFQDTFLALAWSEQVGEKTKCLHQDNQHLGEDVINYMSNETALNWLFT